MSLHVVHPRFEFPVFAGVSETPRKDAWKRDGRIEEIEDPLMRNIRYLDKLVDELAKGRPMQKILRG